MLERHGYPHDLIPITPIWPPLMASTTSLRLEALDRTSAYAFGAGCLRHYRYHTLSKPHKGLVARYVQRMTGYSPATTKRLIAQVTYTFSGRVLERKTVRGNDLETATVSRDEPGAS